MKKKNKTKVDPEGIGFVKATFNNTIVTLTDKFGNQSIRPGIKFFSTHLLQIESPFFWQQ